MSVMHIQDESVFDYDTLDGATRMFVLEKTQSIHSRLKRTAEDIIAVGQALLDVKETLKAQGYLACFQRWLSSEFDMSRRMAVRFMQVARRFGKKNANLAFFSASVLYELAQPITPDTIVEMVESGQIPATLPAIREAIQQERNEHIIKGTPVESPPPRPMIQVQSLTSLNDIFPGIGEFMEKRPPVPESWALPPEMRQGGVPKALQSSASNEWFTPAEYLDAARELMGIIDLDPASNALANEVVQAKRYYSIDDDGLQSDWSGRVWLNPPYGFQDGRSNQEIWTQRLIQQYTDGITEEAVLLVNANTEAKWFQPLYKYLICLTNHRIRFYNHSGESSQPTQGNAFVYFGPRRQRFIEIFKRFGTVIQEAQHD